MYWRTLAMNEKLIITGLTFFIAIGGILASIVVFYIKNLISKLDDVIHIRPMLTKMDKLIDKVSDLFTAQQMQKTGYDIKINSLETRVKNLEAKNGN